MTKTSVFDPFDRTTQQTTKVGTSAKAGVLPAWSGKSSPGIIERAFALILERPTATFDYTLGGSRVRGFLGQIDGNRVALFVYKEGRYQGQLAWSFVPSANQLKMWGMP